MGDNFSASRGLHFVHDSNEGAVMLKAQFGVDASMKSDAFPLHLQMQTHSLLRCCATIGKFVLIHKQMQS